MADNNGMTESERVYRLLRMCAICVTIMVVFGTATCQGGEHYLKGVMAEAGMSAAAIRCAVDGYEGECAIEGLVRVSEKGNGAP